MQTNAYLTERGFTLHSGLLNDGRLTLDNALQSVIGLRQQANSGEQTQSAAAAANMCYGKPFNPCDVRSDKPAPYDLNCVRVTAMNMGYNRAGTLLKEGGSYWNQFPFWRDVVSNLARWKQIADSGPEPTKQADAITKVYGVSVNYPVKACIVSSLPHVQVWYDGMDPNGDGTIPADGSDVNTWVNKAGFSSFNAVASSPAKYSAAAKALYFNNNMYSTNYSANPTEETIFIVFNTVQPTSTVYNAAILSGYTGARGFWTGYTDGAGSGRGAVGILSSDVRWNATTPTGSYQYGKTAIAAGLISGGQSTVSLNGGPLGVNVGPTNFYPGTTTFIGGQYGAGHRYNFNGYAMEVIICRAVLTISQIQQVEGYLAWKWGVSLPAGHPFQKKAPSSYVPAPILYTDYNFGGKGVEFDIGSYPFSAFTAKIPNDSVSSVFVPPGYKVTIYQGDLSGTWGWPNYPRVTLTESVKDLRSMPGYDKTMSAVEVARI